MKDYIRINTMEEAAEGVIDAGRMTPKKVKAAIEVLRGLDGASSIGMADGKTVQEAIDEIREALNLL